MKHTHNYAQTTLLLLFFDHVTDYMHAMALKTSHFGYWTRWSKWLLNQMAISPDGYWTKWLLVQMAIRPSVGYSDRY